MKNTRLKGLAACALVASSVMLAGCGSGNAAGITNDDLDRMAEGTCVAQIDSKGSLPHDTGVSLCHCGVEKAKIYAKDKPDGRYSEEDISRGVEACMFPHS